MLLDQPGVGPLAAAQVLISWSQCVTRRRAHGPTIAYINRRIQEGKSRREATRCLKRHLARNLYRLLENGAPLPT